MYQRKFEYFLATRFLCGFQHICCFQIAIMRHCPYQGRGCQIVGIKKGHYANHYHIMVNEKSDNGTTGPMLLPTGSEDTRYNLLEDFNIYDGTAIILCDFFIGLTHANVNKINRLLIGRSL